MGASHLKEKAKNNDKRCKTAMQSLPDELLNPTSNVQGDCLSSRPRSLNRKLCVILYIAHEASMAEARTRGLDLGKTSPSGVVAREFLARCYIIGNFNLHIGFHFHLILKQSLMK